MSNSDIYEYFRTTGCCTVCCLRLLGKWERSYFQNVDDTLRELGISKTEDVEMLEDQGMPKTFKPNPCIGCLGLLQKPYSDSIVETIIEGVDVSSYDSKTFNVSMNLPSCHLLRSHALLVHLRKRFPAFCKENFKNKTALMQLKDCFKACFGHQMTKRLGLTLDLSSGFTIDVEFKYDEHLKECKPLCQLRPKMFNSSHVKFSGFPKNRIESVLDDVTDDEFIENFDCPPKEPTRPIRAVIINLIREPTNVAGRYNKYCRHLPQTPWLLNGERKMESSVEEIISEPIVKKLGGVNSKFASSGREDVDVRSLGQGRPFNVEVMMPKRGGLSFDECRQLEKDIFEQSQGKLRVRDLQIVSRESLATLKQGEEHKTKEYLALCICPNGIPSTLEEAVQKAPIVLDQSTPIRVLHRRPVAVRQRKILESSCQRLEGDDQKFILRLRTEAGTYVKEFVHGDFGRTKPSLGDLLGGTKVDLLALDVVDVALDWPPKIDYKLNANGNTTIH